MAHQHRHGHGAHGHPGAHGTRLAIAAGLTGLFMVAEVIGGLLSGSLALLADAGHMLTDFAALLLAAIAARLAQRPADRRRTYGFDRVSVLVAFVNGLALFVIAGFIVVEAVQRLTDPHEIAGPLMLAVAIAGLIVNIVAFVVLSGGEARNLNMRGAALHVLGDLLGSAAAILAALIILVTGWTPADPLLSVLVALLILRSAWQVVRDAGHILLEAAPPELDTREIGAELVASIRGLDEVHHVHAWSISEERRMMTLHARLAEGQTATPVVAAIKRHLRERHGVDHVTVEAESAGCADEPSASPGWPDPHQELSRR